MNTTESPILQRVAIDTNALYTSRAGVARYIKGLLSGFEEINDPSMSIQPLAWEVNNLDYNQPLRFLKTGYREIIWTRTRARSFLKTGGFSLLHSAHSYFIHPPKPIKNIITLHDLALIRHPERFRPWHRIAGKKRYLNLHKSDKVICVSRFTADEAMALLNLPSSKIEVIHNGCDILPANHSSKDPSAVPKDLPEDFFLFVGSLEPGKNLALIKKLYELAENQGSPLPALLIVGARRVGVTSEGSPLSTWVFLGHVPDSDLVVLYRNARALLFPSKYEGFGLPVLEAMVHGCPVIASPVASLPEIAGDAAIWASLSAKDYLESANTLMRDEDLRAEKVALGYAQSRKFSWKSCAQHTLDLYKNILHG